PDLGSRSCSGWRRSTTAAPAPPMRRTAAPSSACAFPATSAARRLRLTRLRRPASKPETGPPHLNQLLSPIILLSGAAGLMEAASDERSSGGQEGKAKVHDQHRTAGHVAGGRGGDGGGVRRDLAGRQRERRERWRP